jgi:cell wall-associated NlpC family hydrolase
MAEVDAPQEAVSEPSEPTDETPTKFNEPDKMRTAAIQVHNQKFANTDWQGPQQVHGWHIANDAMAQLGQPFKWGGNQPGGFDSQGLAKYAYQNNGLPMSQLIHNQIQHGEQVPPGQLQPGDLVFVATGNPQNTDQTGVYVGDGVMVHATPGDGVIASRVSHIGRITGTMHLGSVTRTGTKKPEPIPKGLYETDDVMPHNRLSSYLKPAVNNIAGVH